MRKLLRQEKIFISTT